MKTKLIATLFSSLLFVTNSMASIECLESASKDISLLKSCSIDKITTDALIDDSELRERFAKAAMRINLRCSVAEGEDLSSCSHFEEDSKIVVNEILEKVDDSNLRSSFEIGEDLNKECREGGENCDELRDNIILSGYSGYTKDEEFELLWQKRGYGFQYQNAAHDFISCMLEVGRHSDEYKPTIEPHIDVIEKLFSDKAVEQEIRKKAYCALLYYYTKTRNLDRVKNFLFKERDFNVSCK